MAISSPDRGGNCSVFFELNGETRVISVPKAGLQSQEKKRPKAEAGNKRQIAAMMPGVVGKIHVEVGDIVKEGDAVITLEAMKMETTLRTEIGGIVKEVSVASGDAVESQDLLLIIE